MVVKGAGRKKLEVEGVGWKVLVVRDLKGRSWWWRDLVMEGGGASRKEGACFGGIREEGDGC